MSLEEKLKLIAERTHGRFLKTESCWLWTAGKTNCGYGSFKAGNKCLRAHRAMWELHNKKSIPAGMFACHTCDVKHCVNPAHIFVGTPKDNTHDALKKGLLKNQNTNKTHCIRGHLLSESNTYLFRNGNGIKRKCKKCGIVYAREYYRKSRGGNVRIRPGRKEDGIRAETQRGAGKN